MCPSLWGQEMESPQPDLSKDTTTTVTVQHTHLPPLDKHGTNHAVDRPGPGDHANGQDLPVILPSRPASKCTPPATEDFSKSTGANYATGGVCGDCSGIALPNQLLIGGVYGEGGEGGGAGDGVEYNEFECGAADVPRGVPEGAEAMGGGGEGESEGVEAADEAVYGECNVSVPGVVVV